jgi:membrane protein required for colicin V production
LQALDLIFIILMGLLVLRGFLKGFTGEFFSIASIALALIAAVFLFRNGGAFIRMRYLNMAILPEILAFLLIFAIVFIAGKLVGHIVHDIINRLNLHTFDKILGIFLGLAEALAVIFIILFILVYQPLFNPASLLEKSLFAWLLMPFIGVFRV